MAKFNRKAAIAALDNSKFIKKFEDNLEPINGGWVIYWKGKPVKPIGGNNHYFASREAAIQGIDRNMSFHSAIKMELAKTLLGLDMSDGNYPHECKAYNEYFRRDLFWNTETNKYVDKNSLSEEEQKIREEKQNELSAFETFANNALKTVFVKQWLEEGLLEIKLV